MYSKRYTQNIRKTLKKIGGVKVIQLTTCLNVNSRTRHERYIKNKQNPKFLFEQTRKI